jgi:4-hydroxy-tetrahydrodipicolinate synthase
LGGHGGISVTANVTPNELQKAYLAAIAGNAELANQLNEALSGLHKNLFIESNPIPVKWALHKMGMCDRGIRLPLLELSKQCRVVLENDLKELGLI